MAIRPMDGSIFSAQAAAEEKRKKKRHNFYLKYPNNIRRGLWRLIAAEAGVHMTVVRCIVEELEVAAYEARKNGWIGNFSPAECAANVDVPIESVEAVMRGLYKHEWLIQECISEWALEQQSDPTATDRQRNRRARKAAAEALRGGYATQAQIDLLTASEKAGLERLDALLKFGDEAPTKPFEVTGDLFEPEDGEGPKVEQENDRRARLWLLGNGLHNCYGIASRVVASNLGMNRMAADFTIRRWLNDELKGDAATLATIVSGAHQHAITGEAFRAVVERSIAEKVAERENGPALPFGMTAQQGGKRG